MSKSSEKDSPKTVVFTVGKKTSKAEYHAGETLLQTARRAGINISTGCENGDCGACMVGILEGSVDMHRNSNLSEQDIADGCVLACQAVPTSGTCKVEIY